MRRAVVLLLLVMYSLTSVAQQQVIPFQYIQMYDGNKVQVNEQEHEIVFAKGTNGKVDVTWHTPTSSIKFSDLTLKNYGSRAVCFDDETIIEFNFDDKLVYIGIDTHVVVLSRSIINGPTLQNYIDNRDMFFK